MSKEDFTHKELEDIVPPFVEDKDLERRQVQPAQQELILIITQDPPKDRPSSRSAFVHHGEFFLQALHGYS